MIKLSTLARSLAKVGISLMKIAVVRDAKTVKLDLGHGAEIRLLIGDDDRLSCVSVRDVVSRKPTATDVTTWTSREIAEWASARYAGRRVIRGVNVAGGEFWFTATVSRKHLERSGAPADVLSPVGAKVQYILSFTDELASVTAVPI